MEQFQKGDVVELKSGGPKMTVAPLSTDSENGVTCVWFVGKDRKEAVFNVDALKKLPHIKPDFRIRMRTP